MPGAKKRTSIFFSGWNPGTSGQMVGRSNSETNIRAGSLRLAVKGSVMRSAGGISAAANMRAKASFGTAFLSPGMGSPPSATWKDPSVVRRSLAGLCKTP